MSRVDEPENEAAGPHTQRNPGASQTETATASGARPTGSQSPTGSDTLLSVPAPASREDLAFDERLSACEKKLDELVRRVDALERGQRNTAETPQRYWIWLIFLAALALAWQIISLFR
jgi:hypothetical protein